jgi:hypothetical protein
MEKNGVIIESQGEKLWMKQIESIKGSNHPGTK